MSYHGAVTFSFFTRQATYVEIIRKLMSTGWQVGHRHPLARFSVQFLPSSEESWKYAMFEAGEGQSAFRLMADYESAGVVFVFDMHWAEDGTGVSVWSDPKGKKLHVGIARGHHVLPGFAPYADHSWYTPKFLGPLNELGCIVDVIEWDESP